MVLSGLDGDSLGFDDIERVLNGVVDHQLGGALTDLSLHVEHETAAEHVDLVVIGA